MLQSIGVTGILGDLTDVFGSPSWSQSLSIATRGGVSLCDIDGTDP
jgi:hypothetical protein